MKRGARRWYRVSKKSMCKLVAYCMHVSLMEERSSPLYVIEKGGEYEDAAVHGVGLHWGRCRVVCVCPVARIP